MASIQTDKEEYADIVIAFLLDMIMNTDEMMTSNERFTEIIDLMERRGLKPFLLHYYMGSSSKSRSKWKQLRKNFVSGKSQSGSINIRAGKEEPEEDEEKTRGMIKKVLKLVKAHRQRNGFPLNETKIDRIIDRVFIDEGIIKEKE